MSLIGESFGMITGFVLSGGEGSEVSEVLVFGNSVLTLDSTSSWVLLVSMDAVDVVSICRSSTSLSFCIHFDLQSQVLFL